MLLLIHTNNFTRVPEKPMKSCKVCQVTSGKSRESREVQDINSFKTLTKDWMPSAIREAQDINPFKIVDGISKETPSYILDKSRLFVYILNIHTL